MSEPSAAIRRLLAVCMLAIAALSAWSFVLVPLYTATHRAVEALEEVRFERQRLQRLAANAERHAPDTMPDALQALDDVLFSRQTDSGSGAAVLSAIDRLIRDADGQLLQMKALSPMRSGSLTRHAVEVTVSSQEAAFAQLLAKIEQHRPVLSVDRLVLSAANSATPQNDPPLTIELRVSGFSGNLDEANSEGDIPDAR